MAGNPRASSWEDHYSPKYNRCFVSSITSNLVEGAGKDLPALQRELVDAFEKITLAQWVSDYPGAEGQPGPLMFSCHIEYQPATCLNAKRFINEHMKN